MGHAGAATAHDRRRARTTAAAVARRDVGDLGRRPRPAARSDPRRVDCPSERVARVPRALATAVISCRDE